MADKDKLPDVVGVAWIVTNGRLSEVENDLKAKEAEINSGSKHQILPSNRTSLALDTEHIALKEALKKEDIILKLSLEVGSLKKNKQDLEKSVQSLKFSNSLLQTDIEKYKLLSKNSVKSSVSDKSLNALKIEKQQHKVELEKRDSRTKVLTRELEKLKGECEAMATESGKKRAEMEIKLGELQILLEKEKASTKQDRKQKELDDKKIQDLNRQVKEMERILKRNHPNSISALILAANSEDGCSGSIPRIKYLENRIEQLEKDLEMKQNEKEMSVKAIEEQFQTMKEKYDTHSADISSQWATWKHDSNYWRETAEKHLAEVRYWKSDASSWKQTAEKHKAEVSVWKEKVEESRMPTNTIITDLGKRVLSMEDLVTPQEPHVRGRANTRPSSAQPCRVQLPARVLGNVQAIREEAHLLATIRGLQNELAGRDKTIRILEKKLDEITKTNKRLQKERENLLNRDVFYRPPKFSTAPKVEPKVVKAKEADFDSNTASYLQTMSKMKEEIDLLKEKNYESMLQIRLLNNELGNLNEKRLLDLEALQEEHNMELARLLSENSSRNSGTQISQLMAKISSQENIITVLKECLSQGGNLQDEVVILKAEKEHLERSLEKANQKLCDLSKSQSPDQQKYEYLEEQVRELERRHESREERMQQVIRDLLNRNSGQHIASSTDQVSEVAALQNTLLQRDRQVLQYKQELDAVLQKVQEYERMAAEEHYLQQTSSDTG